MGGVNTNGGEPPWPGASTALPAWAADLAARDAFLAADVSRFRFIYDQKTTCKRKLQGITHQKISRRRQSIEGEIESALVTEQDVKSVCEVKKRGERHGGMLGVKEEARGKRWKKQGWGGASGRERVESLSQKGAQLKEREVSKGR